MPSTLLFRFPPNYLRSGLSIHLLTYKWIQYILSVYPTWHLGILG